jgi:hypothetical protein
MNGNERDPGDLLVIARAAHLTRNRDLERVARQELQERYGIGISFARPLKNDEKKGARK